MMISITPTQLKYLEFLEAHKIKEEPMIFISQNKANLRFGKANVRRWRDQGKIKTYQRPKTVEYKMRELLIAAENQQDYL